MTTKNLGRRIDRMLSRGYNEKEISEDLNILMGRGEISREQYNYALRCIKLYFGLRDGK